MLQQFRDQKNSALIVILFGLIIVVFVFMFGLPSVDSCQGKSQGDLGSYASHDISYSLTQSMILRQYDDKIFGTMNYPIIAKQMVKSIAVIYMLADEARAAGMRVSDEELRDYLTNWEAGNEDVKYFLTNNHFDQKRYDDTIARYQLSAQQYEDYKREELLAKNYLILLRSSIDVSDEELWQDYKIDGAKANLEAVRISPDAIRATMKAITDADIDAYLSSAANDIQAYYDAHKGDYTTPAKAKLHQITIQKDFGKLTNPGKKTSKGIVDAQQRLAIAKRALDEDGISFEQAFEDYDETEDKSQNGITGMFPIVDMDSALQEKISTVQLNEVFTAELSNRFIIGKVLQKEEQVITPFDDVKRDIAKKLLDENRIKTRTEQVAGNIRSLLNTGKSFEDAVNEALYADILEAQPTQRVPDDSPEAIAAYNELKAQDPNALPPEKETPVDTDQIVIPPAERIHALTINDAETSSAYIPQLGISEEISRDIRNAEPNVILSKNYTVGDDTVIVKILDKADASREDFDKVLKDKREEAINLKAALLIGNLDGIIHLEGYTVTKDNRLILNEPYGLWIKSKLEDAENNNTLSINESFFNKYINQIKQREKRAEEAKKEAQSE